MRSARRESALWGVVSALLFAVLALGYRLATGTEISILFALGVAVAVGGMTTVLSFLLVSRLG